METPSSPRLARHFGYGCKTWVSREIEQKHLGGSYYVWFSRELNPIGNGDSANPLWIYLTIDRALKSDPPDVGHPKIRDLRAKLISVIGRKLEPVNPGLAEKLKRQIEQAAPELFRPQLWRLDVRRIEPARIRTEGATPGWDEWHVDDLSEEEFAVIVE